MASYHCSVKVGGKGKGKASGHAAYIAREGRHAERDGYEDLEATGYGNLPAWTEGEPALFWSAADRHEIGERHAHQWAIHNPPAALAGGEQPHAHLMYSERMLDGIERDPEQYFKRYNAKHSELGGCRKMRRGRRATAPLVILRGAEVTD